MRVLTAASHPVYLRVEPLDLIISRSLTAAGVGGGDEQDSVTWAGLGSRARPILTNILPCSTRVSLATSSSLSAADRITTKSAKSAQLSTLAWQRFVGESQAKGLG